MYLNVHSQLIEKQFTRQQKHKALGWLAFFHIIVIASSNYLVQIPFDIFGFHTTWGAFTFPFIFLTTDLTIRIFGASLARKIIFVVMIPALLFSYLISVLFFETHWVGWSALIHFNSFVFRIALASFAAYLIGQLMDITVFNYLRKNRSWWVAPSASAIFGNGIDTIVFFAIAFYKSSDEFMANHWGEISLMDYSFKILICGLFFLPLYGIILNVILKKLTAKTL
ncbi:7-cyano-7-deazaguanine/7-aminomethyl-7-deazaguanine transporter [Gilliamella sp. B2776]|uniref:7-cyano-7-deazaguanine/7-aminomethyl-7- deazaguanine transporter n=1 Tax=unclassified Gilliamella TaxID=2685620 RepID=UPI002269B5D9|nr:MULTISPECIES: 7-cyano-7-deazaguanine/7-aminomethyl-7-deazaguanine transporter [unclassified Gilliamella]MCX8649182.1 7-cyano-7-deazaguanine/7-aminomethyl-7-deazaguanine transporter [Gilliamella sp. B2779]MCX8652942.1 7-cyano-7-deazaguanine/7-aminomethyl-7-deazaguanine transporter [Gilliamella sp. B2737]MCX8655204.1 7-cyano-7-deazaguanine/7-aminomethyl-7-deazaguanine transporter [Gilliamella sp. B2894]MCX8664687.1 7-cyano-7-deazaguanine/7-aminomethyl-7-deazaguanine transporter [Gilliamella sp